MFEAATNPAGVLRLFKISGMQSVKRNTKTTPWNQSEVERYAPREGQFAPKMERKSSAKRLRKKTRLLPRNRYAPLEY